jgi:hypothetical protein
MFSHSFLAPVLLRLPALLRPTHPHPTRLTRRSGLCTQRTLEPCRSFLQLRCCWAYPRCLTAIVRNPIVVCLKTPFQCESSSKQPLTQLKCFRKLNADATLMRRNAGAHTGWCKSGGTLMESPSRSAPVTPPRWWWRPVRVLFRRIGSICRFCVCQSLLGNSRHRFSDERERARERARREIATVFRPNQRCGDASCALLTGLAAGGWLPSFEFDHFVRFWV